MIEHYPPNALHRALPGYVQRIVGGQKDADWHVCNGWHVGRVNGALVAWQIAATPVDDTYWLPVARRVQGEGKVERIDG